MALKGRNVIVVAGTYEEFLVGYKVGKKNKCYNFSQIFTDHSHTGSVRCIASSSKYLASGSTDETIRLFKMKPSRSEMGSLLQHEGTITDLQFYGDTHLFTSSEDGTICVWSTSSWQCLKTLRGHKLGVTSMSVHPSGKLMLSVSKDKSLRTWNLIKGRTAYITNIKSVAEIVRWSPNGEHFVIGVDKRYDVYNTEVAGVVHSIDFGKRIGSLAFLSDNILVLGGEGGNVEIHDIKKKCVYHMFSAHSNRIKDMKTMDFPGKKFLKCLFTASSDGAVKLWKFRLKKLDNDPVLLAEIDTKCRITCMAVYTSEKEPVAEQLEQASEDEESEVVEPNAKRRKLNKQVD